MHRLARGGRLGGWERKRHTARHTGTHLFLFPPPPHPPSHTQQNRRRCPSCGLSHLSSPSPFVPSFAPRGGGAFSARRRGRAVAASTPNNGDNAPLLLDVDGTELPGKGKNKKNGNDLAAGEQRRPLAKQRLSSTIPILGLGIFLTALAAVVPASTAAGSPTVLASLLARLKPAPGVELVGRDLYWRIFLAGGVCASISHGWAVPLDVVKTRLQTDPERYAGLGIMGACEKIR